MRLTEIQFTSNLCLHSCQVDVEYSVGFWERMRILDLFPVNTYRRR